MGGHDVERVVETGARAPEQRVVARKRREGPEHQARHRAHEAGRGRDGHQADHDRRRPADRSDLPGAQQVHQRPHEQRGRGGEQRVREGEGGGGARGERAARVEAEPAEPEQPGAEHRQRHAVGQDRLPAVVLAGAEHERGHERGGAGVDVDDRPPREVERAHPGEPAAAPHPVRHRSVDEEAPQGDEGEVGAEAHPLHDGPGHERRRDDREGRLVGHEQQMGDRALRFQAHAAEEGVARRADEERARREGERVPEDGPRHPHEAEGGDAHHDRVEGVLRAYEAPVEETEGGRHQQDERGRGQHPGRVGGVHVFFSITGNQTLAVACAPSGERRQYRAKNMRTS